MTSLNVFIAVFLSLIFSIYGLNVKNLDKKVGPVIFVNMLYRHGDRNPILPLFPNDPYQDIKYWPEGFGQLTNAGKRHHYQLGKWLRKRYLHLIPNGKYHYDIIKIRSTDVDRAIMSAGANLAGMFPPRKSEKWGPLNWQPVPIQITPGDLDNVLKMGAPCNKYDRLYEEFKNSEDYESIVAKYQYLLDICSQNSGKNCSSLGTMYDLHSDLTIESLRNFSLPQWTEEIFPEKTGEAGAVDFAFDTWTREMKRLEGGPLVKKMIENLEGKVSGELGKQNLAVYSAHDSTIVSVMNTMGLYDFVLPPFYSLFLMELRRGRHNESLVTFLYKNTTNPAGQPFLLKLPGCDEACPLSEVRELLSPVIPDDWDKECENDQGEAMALDMSAIDKGEENYDFGVKPSIKRKKLGLEYRKN